jgi:hypothetical protein
MRASIIQRAECGGANSCFDAAPRSVGIRKSE